MSMMPMATGLDPVAALAAMASGGQAPQAQVESPLARALAYAQQQQAQLGSAPQTDPSAMSDMASGQRQQQLAAALMGADYVPNSGAMGALSQIVSAYKGGKLDKKAGETIADALARQAKDQEAQAAYAAQRKAFDEGPGRILSMAERAKAAGYELTAAELASGEFAKPEKAPTSAQEYERAQKDPGYAAFLESRRPKGTSVNVTLPAGQRAFDVELGKADAQTYVGLRDGAITGQNVLRQVDAIEDVLSGIETGKTQEVLAKAGQYFGTEAGADLQTMQATIVPLALAEIKKLGVNPTDKDLEFINQGLPGFGTDPRANARVIKLLRDGANNNIRVYQEADEHIRTNDSLRGWNPSVPLPKPAAAADPKDDPLGIL